MDKTVSTNALAANFEQSVDGCLEESIGDHGLSDAQLRGYLDKTWPIIETLRREYADKSLPLLSVVRERDDVDECARALDQLGQGADKIVFFGTGGSSLGGQVLAQLAGWNIPGVGDMGAIGRPRTRFYDNLDPHTLQNALSKMNLERTRFVVISKSGGTAETMAQAIAALSAVKEAGLGEKIPKLFLGITEPDKSGKSNGLRTLFSSLDIPMLDHHTGIGGRYSCLTNVGLCVGLARGLDAHEVRAGACDVLDQLLAAETPDQFTPALGAAVSVALCKHKDVRTAVMMPYADRLGRLANWFCQLWAESLGKGGEGTSPIAALGPLDQHSQLQLFMDGPRDHFITIIRIVTAGAGPKIDADMAKTAGLSYLADKSVGDIVNAQALALPEALREAGRPVRTIDVSDLGERAIGALMMHFMLETVIAGRLLELDPFDQPAVELAKVLTRERLS